MKRRRTMMLGGLLAGALALASGPSAGLTHAAHSAVPGPKNVRHVLLISVDGLHAADLENYIGAHPTSALARLAAHGVRYPNASTSRPSDSFPGLLSMVTGGSPRSTGVYYDDSYDRQLSAPGDTSCRTKGTEVVYTESIDISDTLITGGGDSSAGAIDPAKLPRDGSNGCKPVYPHDFLRVNTIFQVVKSAGLRTAWADKHPAYDLVNGPSSGGRGVDDLYTPEIAASTGGDGKPLYGNAGDIGTTNVTDTIKYDSLKVQAVINEIDGYDHARTTRVGVPSIFGMNFQAVSVGQKTYTGGYANATATPSGDLVMALDYVDRSLGAMTSELRRRALTPSTLIVITAKHGQAPIDRSALRRIGHTVGAVLGAAKDSNGQPIDVAQITDDDVALVWLKNQGQTAAAVSALDNNLAKIGASSPTQVLSGDAIKAQFGDPTRDSRVPDIIVTPNTGVIYTKDTPTNKIAEHGGSSKDDTSVALLVSNLRLKRSADPTAVQTTQIAPTILQALGLDPSDLQAVQKEGTPVLPGVSFRR